jgi:hypothetical protein
VGVGIGAIVLVAAIFFDVFPPVLMDDNPDATGASYWSNQIIR